LNINQMEQVATNPDVKFVVQWKQSTKISPSASFNGTRRYLIRPDLTGNVKSQVVQDMGVGVDMGVPQTLNDFIRWGKGRFPANHYVVVLWDHGNGWMPRAKSAHASPPPAFSYDDETGHSIQTWQIDQAFKSQHVDITAFDSSLMQMDEVAYQLRNFSDYVVGSEESPPGAGYPYQLVLAPFTNTPDDTPRNLAKSFIDGMLAEPTYAAENIEQSVVDTSQLPALANATLNLGQALTANKGSLATIVPNLRNTVQSYEKTSTRYYFDSIDLCNQLSSATSVSTLQNACTSYVAAANQAVVWEGHNSHSPGSHGLAFYFSPSSAFSAVQTDYKKLAWDSATSWSQWLLVAP
jgi:hypothetical protein